MFYLCKKHCFGVKDFFLFFKDNKVLICFCLQSNVEPSLEDLDNTVFRVTERKNRLSVIGNSPPPHTFEVRGERGREGTSSVHLLL